MTARVALQLYSVREAMAHDVVGVIQRVAAMGFTAVETSNLPGMAPRDAGRLLRDVGLSVTSAHLPLPVGEQAGQVIEDAMLLGAPVIVSGKGRGDFSSLDRIKHTCDLFNRANANVRARGSRFAVHNHWWEFQRVDGRYAYDVMLEQLDPTILLQPDVYWIQAGGGDPVDVVRTLGERAPSLHLKDGSCVRGEPMVAIGDGVMDYHAIITAGGEHTQWLIVEIDRCVSDMMVAVERSLRYLVGEGLGRAG